MPAPHFESQPPTTFCSDCGRRIEGEGFYSAAGDRICRACDRKLLVDRANVEADSPQPLERSLGAMMLLVVIALFTGAVTVLLVWLAIAGRWPGVLFLALLPAAGVYTAARALIVGPNPSRRTYPRPPRSAADRSSSGEDPPAASEPEPADAGSIPLARSGVGAGPALFGGATLLGVVLILVVLVATFSYFESLLRTITGH